MDFIAKQHLVRQFYSDTFFHQMETIGSLYWEAAFVLRKYKSQSLAVDFKNINYNLLYLILVFLYK
jgi:hypothetical protein